MKNIVLFCAMMMAFYCLSAQSNQGQQNIFLNNRNYVYLIFDRKVSDVKFDCEPEDIHLEQLTAKSFGLRFSSRYNVPPEGIGGMVVLEKSVFYPLWLYYSEQLPGTTIYIPSPVNSTTTLADTVKTSPTSDAEVQQHCIELLEHKRNILSLGEKNGQFEIQLHSMGVTATHLYLVFFADNHSKVDYPVDYQGLHIINKSAAGGAEEILPLQHAYQEPENIAAGTSQRYILVYNLFTLKPHQEMMYVIKEQHGGRSLRLTIKSQYLYSAVYPL